MSRARWSRRRRRAISGGAATVIAALIGAGALLLTSGSSDPGSTTVAGASSDCSGVTVSGSGNRLDCSARTGGHERSPEVELRGVPIPTTCRPEGESVVLQAAATVEVHVWCSELMKRGLVQTKLKVWASNPSKRSFDVSLARWALIVPGAAAAHRWSPPPGEDWPRPRVLQLRRGTVTAIPANPDGAAEVLGPVPGGLNYSFATHWRKQRLAPGEVWHSPLRDASGRRYPDGTLVFYVPLVRHGGRPYQPTILGLARMRDDRILTLCPAGRWGRRVSAERF